MRAEAYTSPHINSPLGFNYQKALEIRVGLLEYKVKWNYISSLGGWNLHSDTYRMQFLLHFMLQYKGFLGLQDQDNIFLGFIKIRLVYY